MRVSKQTVHVINKYVVWKKPERKLQQFKIIN